MRRTWSSPLSVPSSSTMSSNLSSIALEESHHEQEEEELHHEGLSLQLGIHRFSTPFFEIKLTVQYYTITGSLTVFYRNTLE